MCYDPILKSINRKTLSILINMNINILYLICSLIPATFCENIPYDFSNSSINSCWFVSTIVLVVYTFCFCPIFLITCCYCYCLCHYTGNELPKTCILYTNQRCTRRNTINTNPVVTNRYHNSGGLSSQRIYETLIVPDNSNERNQINIPTYQNSNQVYVQDEYAYDYAARRDLFSLPTNCSNQYESIN